MKNLINGGFTKEGVKFIDLETELLLSMADIWIKMGN